MAAPLNLPAALDLITAAKVEFMDVYQATYSGNPAYSDYEKLVKPLSPDGDTILQIYAHPLEGMKEWLDARPESQVDFKYFEIAVRKFADSMKFDVDDLKDGGSPVKRQLYMAAAAALAEASTSLWPGLVAEAVTNAVSKEWLPDGQKIFDIHYFNPDNTGLGQFRNYFANNGQGNNASMPLTYANLIEKIKHGFTFKLPNGKDWPIIYKALVTGPALFPTALQLCTQEKLPGYVVNSSNVGGESINEILKYQVVPMQLAGMGANEWMLLDLSSPSKRSIGLKKRQDITWQQVGAGPGGLPDNDAGEIPEMTFSENATKFGPKARGEAVFCNWWGALLCDGT
jgi:hypothetical protein